MQDIIDEACEAVQAAAAGKDRADAWPMMSRTLPHPPGRDLYAPEPDEVPPSVRVVPDRSG